MNKDIWLLVGLAVVGYLWTQRANAGSAVKSVNNPAIKDRAYAVLEQGFTGAVIDEAPMFGVLYDGSLDVMQSGGFNRR
jgi:hypothetical protein